ncbi:MAG TPA: WYL domain-containing protein [Vicinamibacterales bacterium]|jgi:predicted DNA-binding transcriptional regulator YafY
MPRNAEVIRQWTILREIERTRGLGATIDDLAALCGVTTRTIRRDLQALEEAGFPLFDNKSHDDSRTRWSINGQPFKGLSAGLTLSELCALYFSRTLLESLAGTPFRDEVESAFEKLGSALTPHMRQFLDQLPRIIATKADPARRHDDPRVQRVIARALDATLHQREATMTYHSISSERTKAYLIHPYRLAYAQGGLYLLAFVPEYGEVRTFAVERIQELSLHEERFTPIEELPSEAFPHSLGVHSGPPERIDIEFQAAVAPYVRAREWHASQQIRDAAAGGIIVTLDVCVDRALQSWILSFGPFARVLEPAKLAREIAAQLEEAAEAYRSPTPEAERRRSTPQSENEPGAQALPTPEAESLRSRPRSDSEPGVGPGERSR